MKTTGQFEEATRVAVLGNKVAHLTSTERECDLYRSSGVPNSTLFYKQDGTLNIEKGAQTSVKLLRPFCSWARDI